MHAGLPEDKHERCRRLFTEFYNKRRVTLKKLQSLIGLLNFGSSVVLPGRAFLRRMINLTKGIRKPYHGIRLTRQYEEDTRGVLGYILGGYVPPGSPNLDPVLERICTQNDTPF